MSKIARYTKERIQCTKFLPKALYWAEDFEEVTGSDDGGSNRAATLSELQRHQVQPLRVTEALWDYVRYEEAI